MPDINPILDAIDGAIDGYTSADSMRWVPPEDLAEAMADGQLARDQWDARWVELGYTTDNGLNPTYEAFDETVTWTEEVWRRASLYMGQMVFGPSQQGRRARHDRGRLGRSPRPTRGAPRQTRLG